MGQNKLECLSFPSLHRLEQYLWVRPGTCLLFYYYAIGVNVIKMLSLSQVIGKNKLECLSFPSLHRLEQYLRVKPGTCLLFYNICHWCQYYKAAIFITGDREK